MNEEGTLEVNLRLELTDYVRASQWIALRGSVKGISFLAACLLGCLFYIWLAFPREPGEEFILLGAFVAILLAACLLPWLIPYITARRNMETNKAIQEEIHYTFSDRGIDTTSPSSNWHSDWSNINKGTETKDAFLLFVSRNQLVLIPKRCLTSEQTTHFRGILESWVKSKLSLQRS